ncbi:laminin subunit alpha-4 [Pelobates cultripes]|uniref:Laminin subunit alpha-4 n=1 Tax=Pelobates cultripes TaxID=61616 RepID=A0AAD1RHS5_PELCU|nr:laminin subunit alpha-4 [Pelobates cultripes]
MAGLWQWIWLVMPVWAYMCPCWASFEGSASESEGSSSLNPSRLETRVIDIQHSAIPARLVPLEQRCQSGFYYSVSGECLPCKCNGNSQKCLDGSGTCVDCQRNTTGKHCDKCPSGFMEDVIRGVLRNCLSCPCPLPISSNNFALSCGIKRGSVQCLCQENYAGPKCERCAPGYYGNPLLIGSTCKKCDCSGNSDPNLIFEDCNELTGQCNNCFRNSTGFNCERCADWYYGDARLAKNCTECHCSKCGTKFCHGGTGQCHCKPGVTGAKCDRCQAGYYGYDSCLGCHKCECSLASLDNNCDPVTQQCKCSPGTGGLKCERCKSGFWNYSPSGCLKCNCGGGPCNNKTGECLLEDPESTAASDCSFNCDKCIWDMIDDLRQAALLLNETKATILSISTGVAAQKYLNNTNSSIIRLKEHLEKKKSDSVRTNLQIDNVETETEIIVAEVNTIAEKGNLAEMKGLQTSKETIETENRAELIATQISDIEAGIQELIIKLQYYESLQGDVNAFDRVKNLRSAEDMLEDIAKLNFSLSRTLIEEEAAKAQELLNEVLEDWQIMQNNTLSLFPDILDPIAVHNAKLKDLQEAIKDAQEDTRRTTAANMENIAKLKTYNVQLDTVNKGADSANTTLNDGNLILEGSRIIIADIEDLIMNMSGHHAEIDGANKGLQERLANLTLDVEDIVLQAIDHAYKLQRQADGLTSNLKDIDTNGLVEKAINASNVHERILNFVEDANETAVMALNVAERVNDAVDGIDDQINYQKLESDHLLNKAQELLKSSDINKESGVPEVKQRVDAALFTKKALSEKLENAIVQLRITDDDATRKRLERAKMMAEKAGNITDTISKATAPMTIFANTWTRNLKKSDYDNSEYNMVVNAATDTVTNLTQVVPLLLNKLRDVEYKWPSSNISSTNNISSSIRRIRELIAQTRSVASKVQVSMRFGGKSAVDVNLKTSLADLKAYSSLSLYINPEAHQAQPQDRFIMYLGNKNGKSDYMGLAIKNNNLVYVYNLGSGDVEIPLDSKPITAWPAYFSLIKIERLGRHGKVLLTVPSPSSTAEEKFIKKGEAPGSDSLLNLDPDNTLLLVGGVPAGFKLPASLNLPGFVGCLELASLNNDVISLYNFQNIYNINTVTAPPCVRNKLAFTQSRAASYFLDGTGYAVVRNMERRGRFTQVTRFDIEVRTPVDNALIFLMVNGSKFFSLEIQDGFLRLLYDFGFNQGPIILDDSMKKFPVNDAKYHEISVIYHNYKKMILLVDRRHVKTVDNDRTLIPFSDIYIGGAPSQILQSMRSHLAADISFKGCMKGFQFQKKDFNLLEEPETIGISYGCPEESLMSRRAYFNGQSFMSSSQKLSPFDAFEGGLSFRTLQPSGLLLYHSEGDDLFSITMDEGAVVLNVKDMKVRSKNKKYNDGHSHFLVATVSPTRYQLLVDESDMTFRDKEKTDANPPVARKFYFGGYPNGISHANLTGCISNAYFSRVGRDVEVEDFQKYTEKVQMSLYGCPVEAPPVPLLSKRERNSSKSKDRQKKKFRTDKGTHSLANMESMAIKEEHDPEDVSQCSLSSTPKAKLGAHLYGGTANSRQEFYEIPRGFKQKSDRSQVSISLKTYSSDGMIFYVSDKDENNFMTLFLANGQLVFMVNIGQQKLKISSQEKYNNGMWHDVICIRERNKGRLIINGLRVLENSLSIAAANWTVDAPLYVGGVAPGKAVKNVQVNSVYSFSGCLSNLHINGRSVTSQSQTFGVTPCFEGSMESGTYFSSEGGYVILDQPFNTGVKFELVFEVRPRSNSGILIHVQNGNQDYLNMHIKEGQVIVKVRNSNNEFSTNVIPKQNLCDGQWHRIAVIRDSNVVQLDVDSEINHVVGPVDSKFFNLKEPVFVGGAPDSLLPPSLTTRNSFTGCLRNFVIDQQPVSFNKASLVSGAVSINTCPAA